MKEFLDRYGMLKYVFLAVSGFLTALTLMIPAIGFLEWVTLVPSAIIFIITARDRDVKYKKMYLYGFVYYMSFYLSVFHWFINLYPLSFIDGMTKFDAAVIVAVAWFGLSLLQGVFAAFMPMLLAFILRRGLARKHDMLTPFVAAATFTIFEWMQTLTWAGVPWGRLSIGQTGAPLMIKSASVFGSYFITYLLVAANFFVAMLILADGAKKKKIYLSLATGALALNLFVGIGATIFDAKDGNTFKAAAIQVNSSSHEKWKSGHLETIMETIEEYSIAAADEGAKLIVLPETVFPYYPLEHTGIYRFMTELAVRCNATIVVGGFTERDGLDENSLLFVHPNGTVSETVYVKRRPVPFGEYVPMRELVETLVPQLTEISMLGEDLAPGEDSEVVDTELGKIGGLVCFDSIYENLALDSVRDGAEIIVLGTNDSWFLDSAAVYMHNAQAKLRAVETGRYVVRAANTGISSIITPSGKVLDEEPPLVGGYVIADVATRDNATVYSLIGNLFVYVLIAGVIFLGIYKKSLDK